MGLASPILIVGLGVTGRSIYRLLSATQPKDTVIKTWDEKDAAADLRTREQALQSGAATLVVSPGVPLRTEWIQSLLSGGARLTSELAIASQFLTTEKKIGVTGSVGKSTAVSLFGEALEPTDFVGGNLGTPLADYCYQVLFQGRPRARWMALELSSYQLENLGELRFDGAVITALTPNHLERYLSKDHYYNTKLGLLDRCSGPCVLNSSGLELKGAVDAKRLAGGSTGSWLWTDRRDSSLLRELQQPKNLLGTHNEDLMALVAILLSALGFEPSHFWPRIRRFSGLPHRLENLGVLREVLWINDSKATAIASVLQACQSVEDLARTRSRCFLLLGGRDKSLPWEQLAILKSSLWRPRFFGEISEVAQARSGLEGPRHRTLAAALDALEGELQPGDLVLLSPGGTSLDEFKSFEERGDFFKRRISQWTERPR